MGNWLLDGGNLALTKSFLMLLLVRGANIGVDLTLVVRLLSFAILCQYFLIIWLALRAVGVYLVEKIVL